ncbi:hypothetical protein [Sulfuricurvum sp. RIFCSPLOWO2_12_FULL_43_24]|uniref:hypothetical protein n=1 Tax=Sulfuricurvum sp. RIFCSPLOWO2_12_FULL_43_24 TaxID=1802247 RepID=UPI0008D1F6F7|nr:hypothetical protein [Sulfuricurvum sp. RIFCSPLOWO2_12_FULL_43_24]OHD90186.1 MAG: hypothetical protein A3G19_09720 [Sulfuricurvum sp. RIFCSPLOWO2_12_FULL_43_24]
MNESLIIKIPNDRESYVQSIIFLVILTFIVLFAVFSQWKGTVLDYIFVLIFGLTVFIILEEKIGQFLKIDSVEISENFMLTKKNNIVKNSVESYNIGLKVSIGTDGLLERSFYDISNDNFRLICKYKEKDIGQEKSDLLLNKISEITGCIPELLSNSTHGHVIPLCCQNDTAKAYEGKMWAEVKKSSFS